MSEQASSKKPLRRRLNAIFAMTWDQYGSLKMEVVYLRPLRGVMLVHDGGEGTATDLDCDDKGLEQLREEDEGHGLE